MSSRILLIGLNFQLETVVPAFNQFIAALSEEWEQTKLTELLNFDKLLEKFRNKYQFIIEGGLLMVSAAIMIVLIEAVLSIITTLIALASLTSAIIASYQMFSNRNHEEAVKYTLYSAMGVFSTSLIGMVSSLLCLSAMGLVVYKASDLIKDEIPESVKVSAYNHIREGWIWCSAQIDTLQTKGNALFEI